MKKSRVIFICFKSILLMFLLFVGAILFSSCSNKIHQLYSGPKRPSNEIAILTSFDPVRLLKIDKRFGPGNKYFGYSSRWDSKCIVELEPGIHTIVCKTVKSSSRMYPGGTGIVTETETIIGKEKTLNFDFESGRIYQILEVTENSFEIIEVKQIPSIRKPYDKNNRVN